MYVTVVAVNPQLGPFANQGWYENILRGVAIQSLRVAGSEPQTGVETDGRLPGAFELMQNYPNPFNPQTTIRYALPQASVVKIEVYDVRGVRVQTLVDDTRPAGRHEVVFEAGDLASGLYFCRIYAGGHTQIRKMTLLK